MTRGNDVSKAQRVTQKSINLEARARDPLWEDRGPLGKSPKECTESLHFITIGPSTQGKRAMFKLFNDGALARVENYIAQKNYVSSTFKNSCQGVKTLNYIES